MTSRRISQFLVSALVVALTLLIYGRALHYPLIFDDIPAVEKNLSIRTLWPLTVPLHPPDDSPLAVRPLINLSMALNYSVGETNPVGYRVVSLSIHVLSCLLLWGVVRLSVQRVMKTVETGPWAEVFAAAVALLWLVHPLNTEAVVYVTQRTELMASLFYLLTLYAAIRGWNAPQGERNGWFGASILACFAGMASKEIMVSAPLFVLLYDRTLVSGTFRGALRRSRGLYIGLAASWGLLIFLLATQSRGQTAGFGVGITPVQYLETQAGAILWYFRVCFWPHPLTIAHDWPLSTGFLASLPAGLCIAALLAATAWLLWRRSWVGLLGAWVFVILAPTSSIVPIATEIAAERRMYLPLAGVGVLTAYVAYRLIRWRWAAAAAGAVLLAALSAAGVARVGDYSSVLSLWSDAVNKDATSLLALHNKAVAQEDLGRHEGALETTDRALALYPTSWKTYRLRGKILFALGRYHDSLRAFHMAEQWNPTDSQTCLGIGNALLILARQHAATQPGTAHAGGLFNDAIGYFHKSIASDPSNPEAQQNLGTALLEQGQTDAAIEQYHEAIRLNPSFAEAHMNLGNALAMQGRFDAAAKSFADVIRIKPNDPNAHNKLGLAYAHMEKFDAAAAQFQAALRLKPDFESARKNLEQAEGLMKK